MKEQKFNVGDKVFVSTYGRPFAESTVTAVGRKYVTAGGEKFDMNGSLASGYTGSLLTLDEHAEFSERKRIGKLLRELRVETFTAGLTADQLRRILAIVQEPK